MRSVEVKTTILSVISSVFLNVIAFCLYNIVGHFRYLLDCNGAQVVLLAGRREKHWEACGT